MSPYVTVSFWMMMGTFVVVVSTLLAMVVFGPGHKMIYGLYIIIAALIVNMAWCVVNMTRPDFVTDFLTEIMGGVK